MAANVRFLNPNTLAKPPGYTYVVETSGPGRTVYIAGQLGLDLDNKIVGAPGDFRAQATKAIENLQAALAAVGAGLSDVVKITTYIVNYNPEHRAIIGKARAAFFPTEMPPASTLVGVAALAMPEWLVEIEAIAVVD